MNTVIRQGCIQLIKGNHKTFTMLKKYIYSAFRIIQTPFTF